MKKLPFIFLLLISACASAPPVPPDIKIAVEKIPAENLKKYPVLEDETCRLPRYSSSSEKDVCIENVRRHQAEIEMMKEKETR